MKKQLKQLSVLFAFILFASGTLLAQAPSAFYFQSFAFNTDGTPLAEQAVGLEVSIIADSPNGANVYTETHEIVTDASGIIHLMVGTGNPSEGLFENIDWGSANHFLQISTDISGGIDYNLLGVTQILSVPYALFAENLVGPEGETGPAGPAGASSPAGPAGAVGNTGATGAQGEIGPQGSPSPGPTGAMGIEGPPGIPGLATNGTVCWDLNGNEIPDGFEDTNGDGLFNVADCQGPAGPAGATAPTGPQGAQGPQGPAGPISATGATGLQGPPADSIHWSSINTIGASWTAPEIVHYDAGNVGIGTANPTCLLEVAGSICANGITLNSDRRYKQNIRTIENGLESVKSMRGVTYHFDLAAFPQKQFSEELQIGLIAQEVEKIFPELVNTNAEGYKAVNYVQLTPILLEAVKELAEQKSVLQQYKAQKMNLLQLQLEELMQELAKSGNHSEVSTGEE